VACQQTHFTIGLIWRWVTFVPFWKLYLCCNLFLDRCVAASKKVLSTPTTPHCGRNTKNAQEQKVCWWFSTVDIYCKPPHTRNVMINIKLNLSDTDNFCPARSLRNSPKNNKNLVHRIFLWKTTTKMIFLSKPRHSEFWIWASYRKYCDRIL